jgi:hypothetical protein
MRSLPVIDKETDRVETIAFSCLGLVSIVLITFAAFNGGKFATGQDDIVASLKKQTTPLAVSKSAHAPLTASGNSAARTGLAAPQQ